MIMNQKGRGNDNFQTPDYIYEQLNNIFHFTLDVAATDKDTKCEFYLPDALIYDWGDNRCFCNPPFSKKIEFIKRAVEQVHKNTPIVVMILPLNCMDTKVWHEYIEGKYHYEILKGRISFINPITKLPRKGNNSGTVIVYFRKRIIV